MRRYRALLHEDSSMQENRPHRASAAICVPTSAAFRGAMDHVYSKAIPRWRSDNVAFTGFSTHR